MAPRVLDASVLPDQSQTMVKYIFGYPDWVKRIVTSAISTILYHRVDFATPPFKDADSFGVPYKMWDMNNNNMILRRIQLMLSSIFEATTKKIVDEIYVIIKELNVAGGYNDNYNFILKYNYRLENSQIMHNMSANVLENLSSLSKFPKYSEDTVEIIILANVVKWVHRSPPCFYSETTTHGLAAFLNGKHNVNKQTIEVQSNILVRTRDAPTSSNSENKSMDYEISPLVASSANNKRSYSESDNTSSIPMNEGNVIVIEDSEETTAEIPIPDAKKHCGDNILKNRITVWHLPQNSINYTFYYTTLESNLPENTIVCKCGIRNKIPETDLLQCSKCLGFEHLPCIGYIELMFWKNVNFHCHFCCIIFNQISHDKFLFVLPPGLRFNRVIARLMAYYCIVKGGSAKDVISFFKDKALDVMVAYENMGLITVHEKAIFPNLFALDKVLKQFYSVY